METLVGIQCGFTANVHPVDKKLIPTVELGLLISSLTVDKEGYSKEELDTLWLKATPEDLEYYADKFTAWAKLSREFVNK